ncbi:NAD-dependent epimerase/dehydratase family protein [Streptomyces sp. H10-C2]|uniref:NAD-dependent epimerase/dehydratase family protein n=1 Tax=unclassified Streptomyces TaxID=2593676 RepID=UPI0024BB47C8|nr:MULTISPECIES: NAD-dependent epimerase/dehydratase family protein [unclassified Streptomyces]MDJ0346718.1 NAD-dependent epimerase/dehydratase family protein [Streptomyces sp. PH10-H1]MDJ0375164.1 NAD-dependent epimerase/dehydratase family protein [Streptomyces sp. H10-C2]
MSPSASTKVASPPRPAVSRSLPTEGGAILIAGGTGFIGSAVLHELLAPRGSEASPTEIRVLSRRPLPGWMVAAGVRRTAADLRDATTLRGSCDGADTVLHLASYVGKDPALCTAINAHGTRVLLEEAQRAGTNRVVYVSTASVYGPGPHRGPTEAQLVPAPASAASASRRRAEEMVLSGGGIVLRPNLVYGPGDRWFVPTLCRLLRKVPVWPEGGTARTSLIAVQDLARVITGLAGRVWTPDLDSVYHVNHPRPTVLRALVAELSRNLEVRPPGTDLPYDAHRELTARVLPELSAHQHGLLTQDHWYESSRIWKQLGLAPGLGFAAGFAASAPWYRRHLAALNRT